MTKLTAVTPALAGFAVLTFSLITGVAPARAFEARTGELHIVKDCGVPGPANTCQIVSSNLAELPVCAGCQKCQVESVWRNGECATEPRVAGARDFKAHRWNRGVGAGLGWK